MFSTFDYIAMIHEERLSLTNLTERDNILRNLKKKTFLDKKSRKYKCPNQLTLDD